MEKTKTNARKLKDALWEQREAFRLSVINGPLCQYLEGKCEALKVVGNCIKEEDDGPEDVMRYIEYYLLAVGFGDEKYHDGYRSGLKLARDEMKRIFGTPDA